MFIFFCCKQKTAYEMRSSDWSSDVCSSDLARPPCLDGIRGRPGDALHRQVQAARTDPPGRPARIASRRRPGLNASAAFIRGHRAPRSEEHTSELPSLMRTSYAVFCLKKKKQITTYDTTAAT